jgi:glutathione S-transferase
MATSTALPKLTYFNAAGRALGLRIALFKAYGKDGWIDHRFGYQEWGAMKPTTPLGSVPFLTLPNGTAVTQTDALSRWAGKKAGLYPENDDDALIVDEVIATSFEALNKCPHAKDDEEKKRVRAEYAAGFLTTAATLLAKRIGTTTWVVGDDLTIADLSVYMLTDMIIEGQFDYVPASFIEEGFPTLATHRTNVKEHALVKEYLENYAN